MYEIMALATVVYSTENSSLTVKEKLKFEVFEIMCSRNILDTRRNERETLIMEK